MVTMSEELNLREAADILGIEPWRLSRLGRYLGIDPRDKCIPRGEVERMVQDDQVDARYCSIREWLLAGLRSRA